MSTGNSQKELEIDLHQDQYVTEIHHQAVKYEMTCNGFTSSCDLIKISDYSSTICVQ